MNRRDIVIGILILALLGGVIYWRQRSQPDDMRVPETLSIEEELEQRFGTEIPDDVEKAELGDVTGGASTGIATRKLENGVFSHSVLADLPDPAGGRFYEGWLVRGEEGDENFAVISTGRMRIAKGGWVLDFQSDSDLSDYSNVVITLEEVADATPEVHILEGSF